MYKVDLNSDLGESFGAYTIGSDDRVLVLVSSANVACGFHAGDPSVMGATVAVFVLDGSVRVQFYFLSRIKRLFIGHAQWVILFRIVIFTHWITDPIVAQVEPAHIRMTDKGDAIKIKNFTFVEVGYLPLI